MKNRLSSLLGKKKQTNWKLCVDCWLMLVACSPSFASVGFSVQSNFDMCSSPLERKCGWCKDFSRWNKIWLEIWKGNQRNRESFRRIRSFFYNILSFTRVMAPGKSNRSITGPKCSIVKCSIKSNLPTYKKHAHSHMQHHSQQGHPKTENKSELHGCKFTTIV